MAKPEWGTKRRCEKCGIRFYDLNRDPAACPQCGTLWAVKSSSRAQAGAKATPRIQVIEPVAVEDAIDDVAAGDDEGDPADDDEVDEAGGDESESADDDIDESDKEDGMLEDAADLVQDDEDMAVVVIRRGGPDAPKE